MLIQHLKQIGKVKKLDKWVPHELTSWIKKIVILKCHLLLFSAITMSHFLYCIGTCDKKVDFLQLAMTSSVVGPRRSSKSLTKAKHAPKKGPSHYLVVCCWSDPLQLSESQQNHYIWEVCSANQWDALKTTMPTAGIGQQNGHNTYSRQCLTAEHVTQEHFKSWTDWATTFDSSAIFT